MGRIYALGETLYEKIYREGVLLKSIAGGSAVNTAVSLGRLGLPVYLLSEFGQDTEGEALSHFFSNNGVSTDFVFRHKEGRTSVSNAHLDDNNEARYQFFTDFPKNRFLIEMPPFTKNDILLFGSRFAIHQELKEKVKSILEQALKAQTLILYDPNFRKAHLNELQTIRPLILRNMKYASIIRGSDDDFANIFGAKNSIDAYQNLPQKASCLIYTTSIKGEFLHCNNYSQNYPVPEILPVSTIGAGDNFNAGLIHYLFKNGIQKKILPTLGSTQWTELIQSGIRFATEVCLSEDNYISPEFALKLQ
jgi:fructokinase